MKFKQFYQSLLLLVLTSVSAIAQTDLSIFEAMEPRSIGPAGMSGRVTSIDVVRHNRNIIYAGTASGGLWKSVSGGTSWEPLFDKEEVASIGVVTIDPSNASTIWVGTGEGNPRNSLNGGYGVYRSLDAGRTWKHMGLENTKNVHRLIVHPDDPKTVWVGAIGSPWAEHEERGVFKTTDGGLTWRKVLYDIPGAGIADLVIDPTNPNKLVAAMWEHRRFPWFFNSGGPASGIYISYDGGETWDRKTSEHGLPTGDLGRIGLAIAPSMPDRIYAYVEAKENAIYRSDDGGNRWRRVSNKGESGIGSRPFYYADLYVDPENENRVYSLHTTVTSSEDGGKSFSTFVNPGFIHVDNHAFYVHPDDPSFMVLGNDGGMEVSRDRGGSWHYMENLPIGQFYHVSYDMETPYNVMGGMQDNGAWLGPSQLLKQGGIRNGYWERIVGGDGFDVVPDPLDTRYGYSLSQGANIRRYDRKTGQMIGIRPEHPNGERIRWNWNAGVNIDPFDKKTIYLGGQYLFKSPDHGDSWEIISPDLTTNDPEKQKQAETGGKLNLDNSGAEMHTTITVVEPSTLTQGMIWVGTDDGNVQLTRDGGQNWSNSAGKFPGLPANSWVQQIKASTYDAGTAFVIFDEHRRDDWNPYVYQTTNYGRSWKRIVNEGDVFGFALSLVQDPVEPNLMFLGTESGLYVTMDGAKTWAKWTHGYPTVPTMDLHIHPREHDLIIGTFGRAIWILDDIRPLREAAQMSMNKLKEKEIHTFAIPDATNAIIGPYWGYRSTGNGLFMGENKPFNAAISFYARAKGKVKMEVANASGNIVRTRTYNAKEGVNRVYWGFEADGIRQPGSRKPTSKNATKPGGYDVLPGTYQVTLTKKGESSSQAINVLRDQRTSWDAQKISEKQAFITQYYELVSQVTAAVDRIDEARGIADNVMALDKDHKELKEKVEEIKEGLKSLRELIFAPRVQGLSRNPDLISSQLGNIRSKIESSYKPVTQPQQLAYENAKRNTTPVLESIDQFFGKEWTEFRSFVENLNLELVKDFK
ncbi:hypothetical protein BFP97_00940 [Roseivirga sp. 4D4]|uniref:hypothetical protein n=1 Tax=Roseivirga sp. 4D4 TaxID=1889784 RepID=UPI00085365FB|nr:hypothetical protein [Roseivirga sp. 4D4]OEK00169.1 hypothetical protein BFP97_00940 [Roseivirga sp. 4D4]